MGLRAKSVSQLFGLFFLAICIFSASSLAQQPKVLAPHKPVAPQLPFTGKWRDPAVLRSMVGGLWMTDANFKSLIHIKNDLKVAPLTVTPILYLSNGQRYQLDSVKLAPSGTAVISVNDALAAQGIAPYATLSGYVEVQYTWSWDAICVTVHNVDAAHSLLFNYNLQTLVPSANTSSSAQQSSVLEGLWWKQEPNVTGFVSLSNPSAQPTSAMVQVSDDQGNVLGTHTVDVSAHGTKLLDLQEMQTAASNAGGIRLAYSGPQDSLIVHGGLKDPATGFSANLPLHDPPTAVKHAPGGYVALGMMTGEADPMMLFPAGTRFTPYTVVRNISDKPLSVQPTLYWMQSSVSQSAALPQFTIAPYHTQNLNLDSLISKTGSQTLTAAST